MCPQCLSEIDGKLQHIFTGRHAGHGNGLLSWLGIPKRAPAIDTPPPMVEKTICWYFRRRTIPGALGWCKMDFVHPQHARTPARRSGAEQGSAWREVKRREAWTGSTRRCGCVFVCGTSQNGGVPGGYYKKENLERLRAWKQ